jgi:tetratricopeptide (TPR) repeat protein
MEEKMETTKVLPKVFIGSSVEGLDIAHAVQEELEYDAEPIVWQQGIFHLSSNILDDLRKAIIAVDFGIFILSLDDVIKIRSKVSLTVRDNVIFELGLCIGILGKERSFIIIARDQIELHLPTDLLGIIPATFNANRSDENLRAALGPACNKIRAIIKKSGFFRKRYNPEENMSNFPISGCDTQELENHLTDAPINPSSSKESPKVKEYYLDIGDVLFDLKFYGESLRAYEQAINLDFDCVGAYVKKGNVLQKLKLYEEALTTYKQAVCLDPNSLPAFIGQGDTLRKLNRFKAALTAYNRAIGLDPRSAPAHTGKGNILGILGLYEEALAVCEQAVNLDSTFALAHDRRAIMLGALKRYEEALIAHKQAISLDPLEAKFHNNEGVTLKAQGHHEKALAACERAIQLDPDEVIFHYNKNAILRDLGCPEEALVTCE